MLTTFFRYEAMALHGDSLAIQRLVLLLIHNIPAIRMQAAAALLVVLDEDDNNEALMIVQDTPWSDSVDAIAQQKVITALSSFSID